MLPISPTAHIRRLQFVVFFMTLAAVLPAPVYPYYFTQSLGLSSATYGQIVGAASFAHLFAAIFYGRLSDAIGRRLVMLFQTLLSMTLYALFAAFIYLPPFSRKHSCLIAIFITLGISNTVNLLTCSAVCDLCLPRKKPQQTNSTSQQIRQRAAPSNGSRPATAPSAATATTAADAAADFRRDNAADSHRDTAADFHRDVRRLPAANNRPPLVVERSNSLPATHDHWQTLSEERDQISGFCSRRSLDTSLCGSGSVTSSSPNLSLQRSRYLAQVAGVFGLAGVIGAPLGQVFQSVVGEAETRPYVVMMLAMSASLVALAITFSTHDTVARRKALWTSNAPVNASSLPSSGRPHSPLLEPNTSSLTRPPSMECEMATYPPLPRQQTTWLSDSCRLPTSSGPPSDCSNTSPPNGCQMQSTLSSDVSIKVASHADDSVGILVRTKEDLELSSTAEADSSQAPDWANMLCFYSSQTTKALSASCMTVCYGLVLDQMLPQGWFFGLSKSQVLALGLMAASAIRVVIQIFCFQRILRYFGGPGNTLLIGCVLLTSGQLCSFWSLRLLPPVLGLYDVGSSHILSVLIFALSHFIAVGGMVSAGISLIEPSLTSLIALSVSKYEDYQGIAQGLNSASNLIGCSVGPIWFGSMLAFSVESKEAVLPIVTPPLPVAPLVPLEPIVVGDRTLSFPSQQLGTNIWEMTNCPGQQIQFMGDIVHTLPLPAKVVQFSPVNSIRPALVFHVAALIAALPLMWSKRILKQSAQWQ